MYVNSRHSITITHWWHRIIVGVPLCRRAIWSIVLSWVRNILLLVCLLSKSFKKGEGLFDVLLPRSPSFSIIYLSLWKVVPLLLTSLYKLLSCDAIVTSETVAFLVKIVRISWVFHIGRELVSILIWMVLVLAFTYCLEFDVLEECFLILSENLLFSRKIFGDVLLDTFLSCRKPSIVLILFQILMVGLFRLSFRENLRISITLFH